MTQSGQGEEPSARIPREGIVLPSDGSAPLLPGEQQSAPAPGRSWDEPWGPDASAAPAPPPAQPWYTPGEQQTGGAAPAWGDQGWGAPPPAHQQPQQPHAQPQQQAHAQPQQQPYSQAPQQQAYPQALPQPQQQAHPQAPQSAQSAQPAPGAMPPEGAQQAAPLPPQAGVVERQAGSPPPPQTGPSAPPAQSAPLPPAGPAAPVDEGATQLIPPVTAHPGDEAATQFLPPVGPGALPPEVPSDETQVLGRLSRPGAGPMPAAAPPPPAAAPGNPDAEATQYIAPVPAQPYRPGAGPGGAGQRPEPDVFDSLFRNEPGADGAGATQQMPRVQPPQGGYGPQAPHAPQAPYGGGGRAAARRDGGARGRTGSRVPLIAAVGIGIAVLGVGAGALLSDGGGNDKQAAENKPVAAASDAAESPSADPAKEQAVALDKLLADSGDSRTAVINAVADIRRCDNLDKAATDLRDAAKQRNDLVTRLSQLSVDKLPDNAALTSALTSAWKASAAADDHYAAWADQTAQKKGCKKGQARVTERTKAGNRASTTASTEKAKAADLWNSIASTYGLTQRQPTQL
ncbi:hypothetical protein ACFYYD_24435 [Streptomyces bluensis]|uniref:hypothetical protein n=1 Tax=Streptomyces bluensis TaxID=33897 RepID=UPI003699F535